MQSIFASADELVIPASFARLGRWDDVQVPEFGHASLLLGKLGQSCIIELVDAEEDKAPLQKKPEKGDKKPDKKKIKTKSISKKSAKTTTTSKRTVKKTKKVKKVAKAKKKVKKAVQKKGAKKRRS